MRDRDRTVLDEGGLAGAVREDLLGYLRGANAAGFDTTNPLVQAALIHAWAASSFVSVGSDVVQVLEKVAYEARQTRRGPGFS